ncbi:hypothetical protein FEM48_Zijuj01G0216100 [Ziziphus jujuba var. spinosa]|uniref:Apple domain-containing protein n=1 Tax=Ziziphus jujuba var. spinosa TaxID=714518 RepID=A0A978W3P7_ZIZJJ|nr:hypothetical protein FEM48_Zijuj01G0216100 [Ziziphus jujuba var. spinosa]
MDLSQGHVSNKSLNCLQISELEIARYYIFCVNVRLNLKECKAKCLSNCSGIVYTNTDIRAGGGGYAMWFGNLIDIRELQDGGHDLYIHCFHGKHSVAPNSSPNKFESSPSNVITVTVLEPQ